MMDKKLLALLIAPSLLFSWDPASANETQEFVAESDNKSKQSHKSGEGRDDSKGPRGDQNKGPDREPQKQQPQKQQGKQEFQEKKSGDRDQDRNQKRDNEQKKDFGDQMKPNRETKKKEFQDSKSDGRDWDSSQKRDNDQKRDSSDKKRDWESEKRDAVRTYWEGFKEGDKDRKDYRRERISKERFKEKENRWKSKSKEWRKNYYNYRNRDHIFDDYFWDNFRRRHHHWYFDNNFQSYAEPTWPRIVVWLPWQWRQPIYYYYETDGDVYYSTTEDFSYLIPVDSKELFIAQAARIANARYPTSSQQSDWMPLGMFTFASDNDSSHAPGRYISLAISKGGAVSGAYFDVGNNTTLEIQGGIDPESQRIAWKFVGNDWPIMESGLYNLTKEESTLLIHTSSRTTETELLIRLDR